MGVSTAVARQRRDQGIAQAEVNADDGWNDLAWDTLVSYLKRHAEFFVDDFWLATGLERPHESRALGSVVRRAAREGLMEKSGLYRPSTASNMTAKPVWRSLIARKGRTRKGASK